MRIRTLFTVAGSLIVLAALFFTDPDHGLATLMVLLGLATCFLAVAMTHVTRKALFDYVEADMRALFAKARESAVGAGLALIALAIVMYALLGLFGRALHAEPIPVKALIYAPMLKTEQVKFWGAHPRPELLAGLIEQESCLSLTHSRCWSPTSKLKTSREEGAGLGQITRAYRSDGSERFDSLTDMRRQYPELKDWTWSNVYTRPDLQLRAIVLMSKTNYQALRAVDSTDAQLAFSDAAYNGGLGGVQKERRACQIKSGCDPQLWFGQVEQLCLKSHGALYDRRSACDINREHVRMVMRVRSAKYIGLMT